MIEFSRIIFFFLKILNQLQRNIFCLSRVTCHQETNACVSITTITKFIFHYLNFLFSFNFSIVQSYCSNEIFHAKNKKQKTKIRITIRAYRNS